MSTRSATTIAARALGTLALVVGFVVFMARAPFFAGPGGGGNDEAGRPPLGVSVPAERLAEAGALRGAVLPPAGGEELSALHPSFGLFNATFAASEDQPGFETSEQPVPGACLGAGKRWLETNCPDCRLLGGENAAEAEMLIWQERIDGDDVVRSVSRDCVGATPDGTPLVGMLRFHEGPADLGTGQAARASGQVPLLAGATRVASISLGDWSATYDAVPRPSSALPDMAAALSRLGWREVKDPGVLQQDAFQGQRVFTNNSNAVCMISLTKQGESYQLLTIINSSA